MDGETWKLTVSTLIDETLHVEHMQLLQRQEDFQRLLKEINVRRAAMRPSIFAETLLTIMKMLKDEYVDNYNNRAIPLAVEPPQVDDLPLETMHLTRLKVEAAAVNGVLCWLASHILGSWLSEHPADVAEEITRQLDAGLEPPLSLFEKLPREWMESRLPEAPADHETLQHALVDLHKYKGNLSVSERRLRTFRGWDAALRKAKRDSWPIWNFAGNYRVKDYWIYSFKRIDDVNGGDKREVTVDGKPLPPCYNAVMRSEGEYDWGNCGNSAKSLAESILTYQFGGRLAETMWREFMIQVIANQRAIRAADSSTPPDSEERIEWTMSNQQVQQWAEVNFPQLFGPGHTTVDESSE